VYSHCNPDETHETWSEIAKNIWSIEKRGDGGGCPASARRRRIHRDEAVEGEEEDATPRLFLKYPYENICITYEPLETYI
jgi:hypothetical protein